MARTSAAGVIQECILDIKAGHWLCGDLMAAAEANGNKKPDGCAVGLLVINARLAPIVIEERDRDIDAPHLVAYCPTINNPSFYFRQQVNAPKVRVDALYKSLVALALSIPADMRESVDVEVINPDTHELEDVERPMTDEDIKALDVSELERIIIEYNDSSLDDRTAELWFAQALELLQRAK